MFPLKAGWLLLRRLLQQLDEVVLPDGCLGVGAVAVGLHRGRNQDETGVRHPGDQLLGHLQFRRVDEVIGGVDPEHRSGNRAELRLRVIVAGRVEVVEEVVGIDIRDLASNLRLT